MQLLFFLSAAATLTAAFPTSHLMTRRDFKVGEAWGNMWKVADLQAIDECVDLKEPAWTAKIDAGAKCVFFMYVLGYLITKKACCIDDTFREERCPENQGKYIGPPNGVPGPGTFGVADYGLQDLSVSPPDGLSYRCWFI